MIDSLAEWQLGHTLGFLYAIGDNPTIIVHYATPEWLTGFEDGQWEALNQGQS